MELNLVRIVAQIFNFLLLVWLLRRFLFGPIISIMKAREDRIKEGLDRGRELQEEAEAAKSRYEEKLAGLKDSESKMMAEAREQAEAAREELMAEVRREADEARERFHSSHEREQQEARGRLHRETVSHACQLAGKVLERLTGVALEERAAEIVLEHLEAAGENDEAEPLRRALRSGQDTVIHSHSELPESVRDKLTQGLTRLAEDREIKVDFGTDTELICGLRITAAGATLDWNAASHLGRIESAALQAVSQSRTAEGDAGD